MKLASNEDPLGMPESAQRAMAQAASELGRYPDANGFELAALSERYGVPSDWITLGNGSNDILEMAAHAFVEKGACDCLRADTSFAVYALATQSLGARAIVVPAVVRPRSGRDARRDHRRHRCSCFVANPNNPTGTFIEGPKLEGVSRARCRATWPWCWTRRTRNICRREALRLDRLGAPISEPAGVASRFPKAFGLAGLRVGFAIAQPELTDLLNRLRQPFNVNTLSRKLRRLPRSTTRRSSKRAAALNAQGYRRLTEAFDKLGLEYVPSDGNFVPGARRQ